MSAASPAFDRSLRTVMWWDAFLSLEAPIARVATPWVAAVQALFVAIVIDVAGAPSSRSSISRSPCASATAITAALPSEASAACTASTARAAILSASATYRWMCTVVPPRVSGLRKSISRYSSVSMTRESPIFTSAWPMVPFGPGIRITSAAPNALGGVQDLRLAGPAQPAARAGARPGQRSQGGAGGVVRRVQHLGIGHAGIIGRMAGPVD